MNPVYLLGAFSAELPGADQSAFKALPLWRRMTPLQKAVLMAVHAAVKTEAAIFTKLSAWEAPYYFTSAFGELGAMLRVTQSIEAHSLPVSPKDFQHSVLNAALSYVAIDQQGHQPGFAMSGGFASGDLALHLAARRIAAGMDAGAIVIHANEYGSQTEETARAEILILAGEAPESRSSPAMLSLGFIDQTYEEMPGFMRDGSVLTYHEEEMGSAIAWLLRDGVPDGKRVVKTKQGLSVATHWQGA